MARTKASGRATAPSTGPVLDFMRDYYDLPERQLETIFQDGGRPGHERLAAIAAYLYRQPDDAGVRLFYPALEGIETVAFALSREALPAEGERGATRRPPAKPKPDRMARAA